MKCYSVVVLLILFVFSKLKDAKNELYPISGYIPSEFALSISRENGDPTTNRTTFITLAKGLISILNSTFTDARSVMILHDESFMAEIVLQNILEARISPSVQIGNIRILVRNQSNLHRFLRRHQNVEFNLTIILFINTELIKLFLEEGLTAWIFGPILFVSLEENSSAREVLLETDSVRRVSLLTQELLTRKRVRFIVTTYQPFSPSKFLSKHLDLSYPLTYDAIFEERYPNFEGHNFQLASWIDDFPYLFYNSMQKVDGIGQAMLTEISHRKNFTYELQEIPPDGFWGELINGTWVGMLGQVVRKEKDFIINGFAVVLDRYQAADFTVPYFADSYSMTLQVPPPFPRWLSIVYPFHGWVWMGVIIALVVLAAFFHILIRENHSFVYDNKYDLASTLVWLGSPLLYQPATKIPENWGCRLFLGCWWIASLVLSTSYMGNLIAFLTVPSQTRKIATLEELANSKIKIYMLDYGNFVPGYLWSAKEPVLHLLGKKLSLLPDYDDVFEAFDRGAGVLEASEYSQFLFINRKRSDTSYAVEEKLFPNYVGWAFQKGSPYKHIFDRYLEWMSHSGLIEHWRREILDDFRRSKGGATRGLMTKGKSRLQPLTLENLQGAFLVLGFGTVLAVLVLILEILPCHCG